MQLHKLLSSLNYEVLTGSLENEVGSIHFDSREIKNRDIFVARKGLTIDSHSFIDDVISLQPCAIVGQDFTEDQILKARDTNVTLIKVDDSAYVGGVMVAAWYDFPFTKMHMIGVTGTDGKTTTSNLIYHLLKSAGKKVGVISTLSACIFDGTREVENDTGFHVTTPDVLEVQKYLADMVAKGCEYAVIECTSHAFAQERVAGINFNVGVVTNITHEHLDYHKTLERYILAKSLLFRIDTSLPQSAYTERIAVINQDDRAWEYLLPYTKTWSRKGYGYNDFAEYHIISDEQLSSGISYLFQKENTMGNPIEQIKVQLSLFGRYNIANSIAAIATLSELGFPDTVSALNIKKFMGLVGRFERFSTKSHGLVVVDFAHTPHALEEILRLAHSLSSGKITVVFGCAGLRDVEKRYLMGEIAGQHADVTIITVEDPRTEKLDDINGRIIKGLSDTGAEEYPVEKIEQFSSKVVRENLSEHFPLYVRIDDRRKAIESAIRISSEQDIVLICGKGHEKSMNYGNGEVPWSDQQVVVEMLKNIEG